MFEVMVQQRGVVAVSWQSRAVVFQGLNSEASMRHDERAAVRGIEYYREQKRSNYGILLM